MRLFVAVDVPDDLKDAIERDVVDVLRDQVAGARWNRPEGRHLTLAFLGNVEDVNRITDALRGVDAVPFDAAFSAIGGFPSAKRPRVLWCGLGTGRDEISDLAGIVQRGLVRTGYEIPAGPFHPHYTLARFPKPATIGALPEVVVPSDRFRVSEFTLFRSQLHPKGARYTALETFPLD